MSDANQYSYSLDLTPEDYRHLYILVGRHQGRVSTYVYLVAAGCVLPVALALAYLTPLRVLAVAMSCGVAYLFGCYLMMWAVQTVQKQVMQRMALIGAEDWTCFSVTLDDNGVSARGDGLAIEGRWSAVKDVTVEDGALMIWLGRLQAVRIPERAFADIAERDAVVAFARSRMTA